MSDELDKKLRDEQLDLLRRIVPQGGLKFANEDLLKKHIDLSIEQIKETFVDEGWRYDPLTAINVAVREDGTLYMADPRSNLMTGQEWSHAFDRNFRNISFPYKNESEKQLIITITKAAYEAAKKAAGFDDKKTLAKNSATDDN